MKRLACRDSLVTRVKKNLTRLHYILNLGEIMGQQYQKWSVMLNKGFPLFLHLTTAGQCSTIMISKRPLKKLLKDRQTWKSYLLKNKCHPMVLNLSLATLKMSVTLTVCLCPKPAYLALQLTDQCVAVIANSTGQSSLAHTKWPMPLIKTVWFRYYQTNEEKRSENLQKKLRQVSEN